MLEGSGTYDFSSSIFTCIFGSILHSFSHVFLLLVQLLREENETLKKQMQELQRTNEAQEQKHEKRMQELQRKFEKFESLLKDM